MKFDFFTLGGSHFWEDVFFYQKWRIQRNYNSKTYRLLDNWDIKRCTGTFEDCRKAFLRYIEIYQISRQKGHMIIMIHGLFEDKNIFKPLWRAAMKEGYLAAAINYPSTLKDLASHVRQLEFLLNNIEDVKEVSFVTKGAGGVILNKLLAKPSPWQKKLKIKRIVEVCPPNNKNKLFNKLAQYRIFNWLLGPLLEEMTFDNIKNIPNLPNDIESGIIECQTPYQGFANLLPNTNKFSINDKYNIEWKNIKQTIHVRNRFHNVFNNNEIISEIISFLKQGNFK